MSLPDAMVCRKIREIFAKEGISESAAEQIFRLIESQRKFADLKSAPDELGIDARAKCIDG